MVATTLPANTKLFKRRNGHGGEITGTRHRIAWLRLEGQRPIEYYCPGEGMDWKLVQPNSTKQSRRHDSNTVRIIPVWYQRGWEFPTGFLANPDGDENE